MESRATEAKTRSPGLTWRDGRPAWRATKSAIAAGYPVKNVNLSHYLNDLASLAQRCERLQAEMLAWVSGRKGRITEFDGTIRSLIEIWQSDPESPYHKLKSSTKKPYDVYARMVILEVGSKLIDDVDGRDVKRWFNAWAEPKNSGEPLQIPKARTAIAVIKSALNFGIMCRKRGCAEFKAVLVEVDLPVQASRTTAPTAEDIMKVRSAARESGHAPAALAYAIQFDGAVRQWDVIGEWVPMADPRPSIVLDRGMKWIGPMWSQVDESEVFRFTPSKTESTTGKEVAIDFTVCPMIMEELALIPPDRRKGPLIVNPMTGKPSGRTTFRSSGGLCGKLKASLRRSGIAICGLEGSQRVEPPTPRLTTWPSWRAMPISGRQRRSMTGPRSKHAALRKPGRRIEAGRNRRDAQRDAHDAQSPDFNR